MLKPDADVGHAVYHVAAYYESNNTPFNSVAGSGTIVVRARRGRLVSKSAGENGYVAYAVDTDGEPAAVDFALARFVFDQHEYVKAGWEMAADAARLGRPVKFGEGF